MDTAKAGTSKDPVLMESCAFCPTEKSDLYTCPKCNKFYCSVRCYKSPKHAQCSENFYRTQVHELVGEPMPPQDEQQPPKRPTETFEEYMKANQQSDKQKTPEEMNPQIEVSANEEVLFDSDDEPEYLAKTVQETVGAFEKIEMDELDRRLTAAGLGGIVDTEEQLEHLYSQLTDEEKKTFSRLADEIHQQEAGLTQSCFRGKAA